jgi:hydroxymethylbilane synthase
MSFSIRIGTRASKLARAQAEMLRNALMGVHPQLKIEIVPMTTAGDRELHKQLTDWGYKGLFTKELEDALLKGEIDLAVHSMKDMPSILPEGLTIAAMLPRADVRDAWVSPHYASLDDAPQGATIGTSSARRAAQLLNRRPDLKIVPLRGNVETRLRKLEENVASATLLAAAGLTRLGMADKIRNFISPDLFLPAVAQGAIGVECKAGRTELRAMLALIDHSPTTRCVTAERAMLRVLDGSCRTPIAGLATLDNRTITIRGEVLSLDGKIRHAHQLVGEAVEAEALGAALGEQLRNMAGPELLNNV